MRSFVIMLGNLVVAAGIFWIVLTNASGMSKIRPGIDPQTFSFDDMFVVTSLLQYLTLVAVVVLVATLVWSTLTVCAAIKGKI